MGERAPQFDPTGFEEQIKVDLTLIETEVLSGTEQPFFILDTHKEANYTRLLQIAKTGNPHILFMTVLEEVGLLPPVETLAEHKQQYEYLLHKGPLDESEQMIFSYIDRRLRGYDAVLQMTTAAEEVYIQDFLGGDSNGNEDRAKLADLYDETDAFIDRPLLATFERLRMSNEAERHPGAKDTINRADRIARLLVQLEVNDN
jgi:hypothetical protein